MHVDAGLQSPSGKKEFGCGDGASKGLKKVEEFQEPMQIEERPIPVIGAATKSTEKVVSMVEILKNFFMLITWRSSVRSAMHAASQFPGRGPRDVDDAPAPGR